MQDPDKPNNRELAALLPKRKNQAAPALPPADDAKCASCDTSGTKCQNCSENCANLRQLDGMEQKRSNCDVAGAGAFPVQVHDLQAFSKGSHHDKFTSEDLNTASEFALPSKFDDSFADDQASTGDILDNISVGTSLDDFLT